MKNIEISEKQKEMLLEMCKELFPKYKTIVFTEDHKQFEDGEDNNILLFFSGKTEIAPSIHWFEFCIIHLLPKFNFEPDILLNSELKNKHIIDYLYKEFKN